MSTKYNTTAAAIILLIGVSSLLLSPAQSASSTSISLIKGGGNKPTKPPVSKCPCRSPSSHGPYKCQELKVTLALLSAISPLDLNILKIKLNDIVYINCKCAFEQRLISDKNNTSINEDKCDKCTTKNVCCKNELLWLSVEIPALLGILPHIKNIVVLCNGIDINIGMRDNSYDDADIYGNGVTYLHQLRPYPCKSETKNKYL